MLQIFAACIRYLLLEKLDPVKEFPHRLRVVGGENSTPRQPMRNTLKAFKCSNCTDEIGMMAHTLVQVLREPHEANGKLVAGSSWAAAFTANLPHNKRRRIEVFQSTLDGAARQPRDVVAAVLTII